MGFASFYADKTSSVTSSYELYGLSLFFYYFGIGIIIIVLINDREGEAPGLPHKR